MPNRCGNKVDITTRVDPKEFLSQDSKWEWSLHFNKILPITEPATNMECSNIRGTKRDIFWWDWIDGKETIADFPVTINSIATMEDKETLYSIYCYFDTAWSPPIGYYEALLKFLQEKDPDSTLTWYYTESWCWFLWCRENYNDDEHERDWIHRLDNIWCYFITNHDILYIREEVWDDYETEDTIYDRLEWEGLTKDDPEWKEVDEILSASL